MAKRRRRPQDLLNIHVQVTAQEKADLKKLAETEGITVGWMLGRFIDREVKKRERRVVAALETLSQAADR